MVYIALNKHLKLTKSFLGSSFFFYYSFTFFFSPNHPGYIDFRVGDDDSEDKVDSSPVHPSSPASNKLVAVERSHLLVWQVNSHMQDS